MERSSSVRGRRSQALPRGESSSSPGSRSHRSSSGRSSSQPRPPRLTAASGSRRSASSPRSRSSSGLDGWPSARDEGCRRRLALARLGRRRRAPDRRLPVLRGPRAESPRHPGSDRRQVRVGRPAAPSPTAHPARRTGRLAGLERERGFLLFLRRRAPGDDGGGDCRPVDARGGDGRHRPGTLGARRAALAERFSTRNARGDRPGPAALPRRAGPCPPGPDGPAGA